MIWLIIPHTGKKNLRGESNHLLFEDFSEYVTKTHGDLVYFVVPTWAQDESLKAMHGVYYVKALKSEIFYNDIAAIDVPLVEMFARAGGKMMSDVVLTSKPAIIPTLDSIVCGRTEPRGGVIYIEPGVEDKFARVMNTGYMNLRDFCLLGYSMAHCMFLTENELSRARQLMNAVFQPSIVERWYKNSFVNPVSVPIDLLDKYKTDEKYEKFTLFFGARVNDVKRVDEIVKIYDHFYASGRDVDIKICTATPDMLAIKHITSEALKKNSKIELFTDLDREQYLKIARKAHVFVAWSDREGFPVGFWEQMYLGLIGVFRDRAWAVGQLPKQYKYVATSREHAFALLTDLYDNYAQHRKDFEPVIDLIKTTLNKDVVWGRVRQEGLAIRDRTWHHVSKSMEPVLARALPEMPQRFMVNEFIKQAAKYTEKRFPVDRICRGYMRGYPTDYVLHRWLADVGKCKFSLAAEGMLEYERTI